MSEKKLDPYEFFTNFYKECVSERHADLVDGWPIISGANLEISEYHGWGIFFFRHSGNPTFHTQSGRGKLSRAAVGFEKIEPNNIEAARENLYKFFRASPEDGILLIPPSGGIVGDDLNKQINQLLERHRHIMGLSPMKIFLSHKSPDKTTVREYKKTLDLLGFDPWLDEDAMAAGTELDRAILQGMKDSCAAVFFLTPHFADERYLASEINYAIAEKRKRPDRFAIITLLFCENDVRPQVPDLLEPFVWKEPDGPLMALREILRALPTKVGDVRWR
ncbi:toll/interleukin-1 receptor domain-containing protein [Komagataeibacter europaeus]|uniref:toll/interleukin-1 receptor domain-containing protein n=1 Tax=Komagataeibacter europaeus TaxID=33995 RepID=UPI000B57433D|nr:toll/interleukin-1 receptor domain-containing protein [Komagataeibacter europaeus]ARW16883.1 hypothetical protein S101446_01757 [Komagataeibacter europaeus]